MLSGMSILRVLVTKWKCQSLDTIHRAHPEQLFPGRIEIEADSLLLPFAHSAEYPVDVLRCATHIQLLQLQVRSTVQRPSSSAMTAVSVDLKLLVGKWSTVYGFTRCRLTLSLTKLFYSHPRPPTPAYLQKQLVARAMIPNRSSWKLCFLHSQCVVHRPLIWGTLTKGIVRPHVSALSLFVIFWHNFANRITFFADDAGVLNNRKCMAISSSIIFNDLPLKHFVVEHESCRVPVMWVHHSARLLLGSASLPIVLRHVHLLHLLECTWMIQSMQRILPFKHARSAQHGLTCSLDRTDSKNKLY